MSIGCRLVLLAASLLLNQQIVVQAALVCPVYMETEGYTTAFCKGTDCTLPTNTLSPCNRDACATGMVTFPAGRFSDVDEHFSLLVPMCYENGQDFKFKVCHDAATTDDPPVTGGADDPSVTGAPPEAPSDLPAWTGNCATGIGTFNDDCFHGDISVTVTLMTSERIYPIFSVGSCDRGTRCQFCIGATEPFGPLGFTEDCVNGDNSYSELCAGACYGGSFKNDTTHFVWRGCSTNLALAANAIEFANGWALLPYDVETYIKNSPMLTCDAATKSGSCDDSGLGVDVPTDICLRCCETAECNNWVGHGNFMMAESGASTLIQSFFLLLGTFVLTFSTRQ